LDSTTGWRTPRSSSRLLEVFKPASGVDGGGNGLGKGTAARACAWPTGAATPCCRPAGVRLPTQWIRQQGPTRAHRRAARTRPRRHHDRADHLRPAPTPIPRHDHPHPRHPPLPTHRPRPGHRQIPHHDPRPHPAHTGLAELGAAAPPSGALKAATNAYLRRTLSWCFAGCDDSHPEGVGSLTEATVIGN
jgi:hypothetical protein